MRRGPAFEPAGNTTKDEDQMREALALAYQMNGLTTPNPSVGCVIVRGGKIVGRGATANGGRPHAETQALAAAGVRARGATAYVSFEPCAHQGQTAPCARALIEAKVARVVVGCVDPYPAVRGRGIAMLRRAGIATTVGVLEAECRRMVEGFIARVTRGRPFVILKLAMSLDGRIAAASGDSRWISSEESRAIVHRWRREADAVMVGAGTVVADNPRLTCRIEGGRDPARVIIDQRLRCPPDARVFRGRSRGQAILVTAASEEARARHRYGDGVEVMGAETNADGIVLDSVMRKFGERGWSKVLIEGGAHLAGGALKAGVVDRAAFFVAPRIIGGGLAAVEGLDFQRVRESVRIEKLRARPVGEDWLIEGEVVRRRRSGVE
jgi:diaminohydroxyphosphoribosylaminopyrimidine deaminase/5-amino-6-(5-phosphoribosylamino)uracil reductase